MSPFMRYHTLERNDKLSPGVYYKYEIVPPENAPTPVGLKSKVPQLALPPQPNYLFYGFYDTEKSKPVRQEKKPFGIGAKVKRFEVTSKVPG